MFPVKSSSTDVSYIQTVRDYTFTWDNHDSISRCRSCTDPLSPCYLWNIPFTLRVDYDFECLMDVFSPNTYLFSVVDMCADHHNTLPCARLRNTGSGCYVPGVTMETFIYLISDFLKFGTNQRRSLAADHVAGSFMHASGAACLLDEQRLRGGVTA